MIDYMDAILMWSRMPEEHHISELFYRSNAKDAQCGGTCERDKYELSVEEHRIPQASSLAILKGTQPFRLNHPRPEFLLNRRPVRSATSSSEGLASSL